MPTSVDLTITGARPRLAGHLDAMRDAIAGILGLPIGAVGVKASTGNLDGAAGAGRVIAADATVVIERAAGRSSPVPRPAADRAIASMTIRLHDTLSGETRPFEPLEPGHVRMYSCGPTVYGPAHVGNFRSFLFADLLVRYLRFRGLRVTWVMNVTDIDDKIIRGAARGRREHRGHCRSLDRAFPRRCRGPAHDPAGRAPSSDAARR